jgi:hypothetical protein
MEFLIVVGGLGRGVEDARNQRIGIASAGVLSYIGLKKIRRREVLDAWADDG